MKESTWHKGPKFLYNNLTTVTNDSHTDAEIFPGDPEMRKDSNVLATHVEVCSIIGSERFSRFTEWSKRQGAIAKLITVARSKSETLSQDNVTATQSYHNIKQRFSSSKLSNGKPLAKPLKESNAQVSRLRVLEKLSPIIDGEGILRVRRKT